MPWSKIDRQAARSNLASEWLSGMSDSKEKWPMPKYRPGPPKHLHAIGVIANNYSEFEDRLFDIFTHHLDTHKVPRETFESFYFDMSERKRLDFLQVIF